MHDQIHGVKAPANDVTIDEVARSFTELSGDRPDRFDELAAAVFYFQRDNNPVYNRYCKAIGAREPRDASYLPIAAFKTRAIATFPVDDAEQVFESSGTGSGSVSRHFVKDLDLYERSVEVHFEKVFGSGPFVLATHLPHYAERGQRSSLLYMVEHLQKRFAAAGSGSFLHDPTKLHQYVDLSVKKEMPLIVFGTAFGLLEFVESHDHTLPPESYVVETGGMKTYRKEIARGELHQRLAAGFGVSVTRIRSEYGMCELLSQCYTRGEGVFFPPPWMRFEVLDPDDPFTATRDGQGGMLAFFDLANLHTVSAVLTEDRGVRRGNGFEVTGRLKGAELRGCNFLLENL